jgi:ATP-dependent DNA helicase RecQ
MTFDVRRALELLRIGCGNPTATFRDGQEEAICNVVEGKGRLLVVQKTGWGKSFVYFIATKMLRESGAGPALLISPLLSLMRNQLAAAERMGVRAATIHSGNEDDWDQVEADIAGDSIDILLISPERLANNRFKERVLAKIGGRVSLLVVDEAHCISDWGHDFRPHYRLIERIVRQLPANLRLLATTATANDRVIKDLLEVLGPQLKVSRGDLHRSSLKLQTINLPNQAVRLAWLARYLPQMPGSGIIYTLTIRDAEQVAEWLRSSGFDVEAYHSDSGEIRPGLETALLDNRLKALVATSSLGMGFDKPDLGFVVHYQAPGSVVAYYQQVGRAGRALEQAYGVMLSGQEDSKITDFFIRSAFPTPAEVGMVIEALEAAPKGLSLPALQSVLNISQGRILNTLQLLELETPPPITKEGSAYTLTTARLSSSFWERAERLTALRRDEHRQMLEYAALQEGHMDFLIRALDGTTGSGNTPDIPDLPTHLDSALVQEAVTFLKRVNLPIEPRKKWPAGGLPTYGLKGNIAPGELAQPGRALCWWRDAGWGQQVADGKYEEGRFGEDLVRAAANMIQDWAPHPSPAWVTCIPSLNHPELVPEFAAHLAQILGLPFHTVLMKTGRRPPQKEMQNGPHKARNLDGAFSLGVDSLPKGPVLLVDDMVDSGWTLTVAAWLLQRGGSGPVFPMALARTGAGE